ncbi:MAG: ABC transporter permease, partial [Phycisphaeraceae bacterium]
MRIWRNIRLGVRNLMLHKLRSLLTMLGVVFGVASVVAMLAVGEGASAETMANIRRLGSQNIITHSIKPREDQGSTERARMSMYGLLYDDQLRIEESFPQVDQVVPVKRVPKEGRLGERTLELRVVGTTPAWFDLVQRPLLAGRTLTEADQRRHANVAVLTEHGARRLLATREAIGQMLQLGGDAFEVVGIVQSEDTDAGGIHTPDRATDVYIPINAARERFGDINTIRSAGSFQRERVELHHLIVRVREIEDVEPVATGIARMLETHHRREDYRMDVPLALLRQAEATRRTFNIVLGSIAGISLLVGG